MSIGNVVASESSLVASRPAAMDPMESVRLYWNEHVHDLEMTRQPKGTPQFYDELEAYRFEKLVYLPKVVEFAAYKGKRLLEVGCGIGIDLARFASHGALVTGIDLADEVIGLAKRNFELKGLSSDLRVMDGQRLQFDDSSFDVVYAHGVLQYTPEPVRMVHEIHRVLKPGGEAILMVYNRLSWLSLLSKLFRVELEHEDAPGFTVHTIPEFRRMLDCFSRVEIIPERFPVKTRLQRGLKAAVYNGLFVFAFNLLPRRLVGRFGWHLIAKVTK